MSDLRAGVGTENASDMHAQVYYGVISDPPSVPWPKNRIHWHCKHNHRGKSEARECAKSELRRRQADAADRATGDGGGEG